MKFNQIIGRMTAISILAVLFNLTQVQVPGEQALEPTENERDSIINLALLYTGFDESSNYPVERAGINVTEVKEIDTLSIWFDQYINNRHAWVVRFENVKIITDSVNKVRDNIFPSNYEVHIDTETGGLLKIVSNQYNKEPALLFNEDSLFLSYKLHLPGTPIEVLSGLPSNSFMTIISTYFKQSRLIANQLVAYYILYVGMAIHKPVPAWCIVDQHIPGTHVIEKTDPNDNTYQEEKQAGIMIVDDKTMQPIAVGITAERIK